MIHLKTQKAPQTREAFVGQLKKSAIHHEPRFSLTYSNHYLIKTKNLSMTCVQVQRYDILLMWSIRYVSMNKKNRSLQQLCMQ